MMYIIIVLLVLQGAAGAIYESSNESLSFNPQLIDELISRIQTLEENAHAYKNVIQSLAKQISMQQFHMEESMRSSGGSGLKATRLSMTGSRPYHSTSYTGAKIAAIHDHSNYEDTIGMGELVVVLNGVEFRTRHNDYKLNMPSKTSHSYGAYEKIPKPEVPPEVLAQPTIDMQIEEMRLWFKAWKDQNFNKRDYRKYFKPILCYLEGMWTETDGGTIAEPFDSARHSLDADSFAELQDKAIYASGTGRKSIKENYAYLPSTISHLGPDGLPRYSQWNYDIMCHPLKDDLPFNRLRLEDDLGPRVARGKTFEEASNDRFARFSIWPDIGGTDQFRKTKDGYTSKLTGSYLDELMSEIPGKDNYRGDLRDDSFDNEALDYRKHTGQRGDPMNVAYYHRMYKLDNRDAMGADTMFRFFSDVNGYIAFNTRPQITPFEVEDCHRNPKCSPWREARGWCTMKICQLYSKKVSYAIPLEIIYLTPLQSWNPYNLTYYEDPNDPRNAMTNNTYTRRGLATQEDAFAGISNKIFYQTPAEFFSSLKVNEDTADTVRDTVSVLDQQGRRRVTTASGIQIMLPHIEGVGTMRQRYPIMPIYHSTTDIYNELEALKDVTLRPGLHQKFYRDRQLGHDGEVEQVYTFEIAIGNSAAGPHYHTVDLTDTMLKEMKAGKLMKVMTSSDGGHDHEVTLSYKVAHYPDKSIEHLFMVECDDNPYSCHDGHKGWVVCNECPDRFPTLP